MAQRLKDQYAEALKGTCVVKHKQYKSIIGLNLMDEDGNFRCPSPTCRLVWQMKRNVDPDLKAVETDFFVINTHNYKKEAEKNTVIRCSLCDFQFNVDGWLTSFKFNSKQTYSNPKKMIMANCLFNTIWIPQALFAMIVNEEQIERWQKCRMEKKSLVAKRTFRIETQEDDKQNKGARSRNNNSIQWQTVNYAPTARVDIQIKSTGFVNITFHQVSVIFLFIKH